MSNRTRNRNDWQRVSRDHPCQVCGRADWCLFSGPAHDPAAAICARIESDKRCGEAGWLHRLRDDSFRPTHRAAKISTATTPMVDFTAMARRCFERLGPVGRCDLADELGVLPESLDRLCVGWSDVHQAYSFPMCDSGRNIRGIRLRSKNGRKWAVRGSRQGLFIPKGISSWPDLLLICEGPTDTAAMIDLGFDAIGRPSCSGGVGLVMGVIVPEHQAVPREVAIVADDDGPGWRGAWRLAGQAVSYVPLVRVISPPEGVKDAREWKRQGATRDDVMEAMDSTPALQLRVALRRTVS